MTFCAVICEYNPFHNGHKYQLEQMRAECGCDKILCLMSGGFTQRGEIAVFDKYTRARHAVENGADLVLELPAAFAASPAELFAKGAVHILSSLPAVKVLAFGCESGTAQDFTVAAQAIGTEDKQFKATLKENMKGGTSYIRARTKTVLELHEEIDEALLTSPNNILGTEYCRALLAEKSDITPLPIPRVGGGYADTALFKNFSSATALRACMRDERKKAKKALKQNMPKSVFQTPPLDNGSAFEQAALYALVTANKEQIALTPDCSEGLENRLKALAKSNPDYHDMLAKVVSKRYTLSRLKRILAQNLMGIALKDVKEYLAAPLYYKVLAAKRETADELLSALSEGAFVPLTRKSDALSLKKQSAACFACDCLANDVFNVLSRTHTNEYETLFV